MKKAFFALGAALAICASGSTVRIEGSNGRWRLVRDGRPFAVKGGGGDGSKELLARSGGNSFRTWGADRIERDLDEAADHGLAVMAGFWMGHHNHGFSYLDAAALERTEREVLAKVEKIRHHPALLAYTLGNEMELGEPHPVEMWKFLGRLARKVKAIDPDHPVGTVVADIWKEKAEQLIAYGDAFDFIGFNSYGGALSVGRRWRELGGCKPYILTEFGPPGANEVAKAANGMPLEPTSSEKAAIYARILDETSRAERDGYCLGSYVFAWGAKNEITPTWFGTLLPDGTALGAVDELAKRWGAPRRNRCPAISQVEVSADSVALGEEISASVSAKDPDGDRLEWKWTLVDENAHYGETGLGLAMPRGREGAIVAGQGTAKVRVKLPERGRYRLYAYCFDGKGNAAYANRPLRCDAR